ncbi:MAG: GerMN domain-containing protein [Candidatus Rifleibacteriota bacterium]
MAAKKSSRRNQETILFILMGLIIIGLIISGYFLFVKKILPGLAEKNQLQTVNSDIVDDQDENTKANSIFISDENAQMLTLYFPDKEQDGLITESRRVRKTKMLTSQAKQVINEVLRGPDNPELYSPLPPDLKLRGIFFESGVFFIDLDKEFKLLSRTGAAEQLLGVYSIVNSLTELDPNARIRFLIDGREPEGEYGHLDLSSPLSRLQELVTK